MSSMTTRLAPSPTGALHLGNARSFLINWLLARQNGWRIVLRIEDLDGPRIKAGADQQSIEDLRWLGLDWDQGPFYQSERLATYGKAIDFLFSQKKAYACICSRRESQLAASAPHAEDRSHRYPGTCRGKFSSIAEAREASGREPAIRFQVPDDTISFRDQFAGNVKFSAHDLGDFVIAKGDGTPAYQLAVVIDDVDMGITDVVRGNDLIESAARQILLYKALDLENRIPRYTHLPLVLGPDGHRLAKRHGDSRLSRYRGNGVPAGNVLGLLARWCGIEGVSADVRAVDLIKNFHLSALPRMPITFTKEDEQLLLAGGSL
jgi:glutamyl-tRNA synthetase